LCCFLNNGSIEQLFDVLEKSQSLSLYLTKCILASSWFFICLPVYLYFVLFVCHAAACFPLQLPSSLFVRMNMKMLKAFPPFFNPKTKKYLGRPCTLGFPLSCKICRMFCCLVWSLDMARWGFRASPFYSLRTKKGALLRRQS